MYKSETLIGLCNQLENYPPNWDGILARFKSHPRFDPCKSFDIYAYSGFFGELHLTQFLEAITANDPKITLSPSLEEYERFRDIPFIFNHVPNGKVTVKHKRGKNLPMTDYDAVVRIKNFLVAFEMRIAEENSNPRDRIKVHGRFVKKSGVRGVMRSEIYRRKLYPIRVLSEKDVGYVVVIPKTDAGNTPCAERSHIRQSFLEEGGMIVSLYTDRFTFREEASAAI